MKNGKEVPSAELAEFTASLAERYRQLMAAVGTNDHAEALRLIRQWRDKKKATA